MAKKYTFVSNRYWLLSLTDAHINRLLLNSAHSGLRWNWWHMSLLVYSQEPRTWAGDRSSHGVFRFTLAPNVEKFCRTSTRYRSMSWIASFECCFNSPKLLVNARFSPPRLGLLSYLLSHKSFCHIILILGERKCTHPKESIFWTDRNLVDSSYHPSRRRLVFYVYS